MPALLALLWLAPGLLRAQLEPPPVPEARIVSSAQSFLSRDNPWHRLLAERLGVQYPCKVEVKHLGRFFNPTEKLTLDDGRQRASVVAKTYNAWTAPKWYLQKALVRGVPMSTDPEERFLNEQKMNEAFRSAGLLTAEIVLAVPDRRVLVTRFIEGKGLEEIVEAVVTGHSGGETFVRLLGRELALAHRNNLTVGDLKPENVLVSEGKIIFIDLDQGATGGVPAWDIAEFFYYPMTFNSTSLAWGSAGWTRLASAFLQGYREGGGNEENVRRATDLKYLAAFGFVPFSNLEAYRAVRRELRRTP